MTHEEIQPLLVELESTLITNIRPNFLSVIYEADDSPFIHIIISKSSFQDISVNDRLNQIFSLLKTKNPDIIEKHSVIIETFSSEELEDLIDSLFI